MIYISEQPLPVRIPGTEYIVEAVPNEYWGWTFLQDKRKSFLQILCEDSLNPSSVPVLQPDQIHVLWNSLRTMYEEGEDSIDFFDGEGRKEYMRHFFSPEARARGAEYGDMGPTLENLHWEMRCHRLYMNALVVVRNTDAVVQNFNGNTFPVAIHPVTVEAPSDPKYGSFAQFKESGGRIIAHGAFPVPEYFSYLTGEGADIKAVMWMLGNCEVDGPSNTYDLVSFDGHGYAVLRGRKQTQ